MSEPWLKRLLWAGIAFLAWPALGNTQSTTGKQALVYPAVLFSPHAEINIASILKKELAGEVIQKLPGNQYHLVVLAEANSVEKAQSTARVCSVTIGISKRGKDLYAVPNVRFNSIGFSTNEAVKDSPDRWEVACIESALAKAVSDLSVSDLDYLKFMADK